LEGHKKKVFLQKLLSAQLNMKLIKNASFLNVTPCGSCLRSVRQLLVKATVVPSSPILVTLMMDAIPSSETSVLTTATLRNIPEDGILHKHRRGNLRSYMKRIIHFRVHKSFVLRQLRDSSPVCFFMNPLFPGELNCTVRIYTIQR
jgi:hypothetical protein